MTSILSNIAAQSASRQLNSKSSGLQKTLQRLTTGKPIKSGSDEDADNAVGLTTSSKLGADARIAAQGRRNANDGLTLLQTADGVLDEVTNLLTRAADLAQQAASDSSGPDGGPGKTALDAEFQKIITTLADLERKTTFNSASVFGGGAVSVSLGGTSSVDVTVGTFHSLSAMKDKLTTAAQAGTAATDIASALDKVSALREAISANQQRLQGISNSLGIQVENLTAAFSQITDANVANEVVNLSKFQILNQSGISALGQTNASAQAILALLR